jgi:hypothetical protein
VSELDGAAPARWAWPIALIAAPSGKDWAVAGVAAIKEPPAMPAIKRKRAIMRTSFGKGIPPLSLEIGVSRSCASRFVPSLKEDRGD